MSDVTVRPHSGGRSETYGFQTASYARYGVVQA